jgi:hypothetical protein
MLKHYHGKIILMLLVLCMGGVGMKKASEKSISLLPDDGTIYTLKLQCRSGFKFTCQNDSTVGMVDTLIVYTDTATIAEINSAWKFIPYAENAEGIGSTTPDFVLKVFKNGVEYDSYSVFTRYKVFLGVRSQRNGILKPFNSNHCIYFTSLFR